MFCHVTRKKIDDNVFFYSFVTNIVLVQLKVCKDAKWEMGGCKLVARLLATAALWVRIQTSLTNTKWAI
jgi:hypothetical protein